MFSLSRINEDDALPFKTSIIFYILEGLFYLGGLFIYTVRIPERLKPGRFDILVI